MIMQNSENIDTTNFAQYRNNINPRYINYIFPNQYIQNNFKCNSYLFTSEEEIRNSKENYFLTERNNGYYTPLTNDSFASNSIKYYKNYDYTSQTQNTLDTINLNYSILSNHKNNETNTVYNLASQKINNQKNCSKVLQNTLKKNNIKNLQKQYSNQSSNNNQYTISNISNSYNIKNNLNNNSQTFIKNNNNILNSNHMRTKSNVLNDKYMLNFQHKKNNDEKFISHNTNINQTFNNNYTICDLSRRNDDKLSKLKVNKTCFNKEFNNYKINKDETKNKNSTINISKEKINNNKDYISNGKKKIIQIKILNNKKINYNRIFSPGTGNINNIQKISLGNISNLNDSILNNNHSFYERKSFSKDIIHDKNSQISQPNIIPARKKEIIIRNNNDNNFLNKFNSNYSINKINDSCKQKENIFQRINSSKLNNFNKKERNDIKLKKGNSKNNINLNDEYLRDIKSIKENIDTNNINCIYNTKNKSKIRSETINNMNKTLNINEDNISFKNINNINKSKYKQIKINENNLANINLNQKSKKLNILNENEKQISINKSKSNIFSFIPKPNNYKNVTKGKLKKIKKIFSKKNLIQLNNINNKFYQEDIIIKDNNDDILKPQISVRLTLFSSKEEKKGKYFYINVFYSENIKNNPEFEDSDF